jgi:hypothetical protein
MSLRATIRKWVGLALLALALVGVVWTASRRSVQPEFGRIYAAEMVETHTLNWQTRWERGEAALRRWLHVSQRQAPPQEGLQIGPALLGWSLGGHIYMSNPNSNDPLWEFALSSRKRLRDVTREDLRCEFYGMNDPRGTNVFGPRYTGPNTRTAWEEHAIRVPDGQVFLARLVTNRSTVYVIQLGRWQYFTDAAGGHNGRIRVEYVAVENQSPNKGAAPNDGPAAPLGNSRATGGGRHR